MGSTKKLCAALSAAVSATVLVSTPQPVAAGSNPYDAAMNQPVSDPYYPTHGEPYFDALSYHLSLRWRPQTKRLTGTTTILFRVTSPRRSVKLDLSQALHVTRVRLDGARTGHHRSGAHLVVESGGLPADSGHTLKVSYTGSPRPVAGPMTRSDVGKLGWHTGRDGSVWTMQQPWGASTWYPVNDQPSDKAFYSAHIVTAAGMKSVFNGRRVRTTTHGGVTTTDWKLDQPAASYLVTIAVGRYKRTTATGPHGLPLTYWVPTGARPRYLRTLRTSPQLIGWIEKRLGRYPFARAGAVVVPARSAVETQTMVTMGSGIWGAGVTADLLHEYVHQWFGDQVTPTTWSDLWLNEGLTTYLQALWESQHGGQALAKAMATYGRLDCSLRQRYGAPGAFKHDEFASQNVYISGARVIDRIRHKVGDKDFWAIMRAWPRLHAYGTVDRADFIALVNSKSGRDLSTYINAWLTQKAPSRCTR